MSENEYINVEELGEHIHAQKDKEANEKIVKTITYPWRKSSELIRKAYLNHKQKNLIKEGVAENVYMGKINSPEDVEKKYAFGSDSYKHAMYLIRQKQISQAREKATFEAKKKLMERTIAKSYQPKQRSYLPQNSATLLDTIAFGTKMSAPPQFKMKRTLIKKKHAPKYKMTKTEIPRVNQAELNRARDKALIDKIMRM